MFDGILVEMRRRSYIAPKTVHYREANSFNQHSHVAVTLIGLVAVFVEVVSRSVTYEAVLKVESGGLASFRSRS